MLLRPLNSSTYISLCSDKLGEKLTILLNFHLFFTGFGAVTKLLHGGIGKSPVGTFLLRRILPSTSILRTSWILDTVALVFGMQKLVRMDQVPKV